MMRKKFDFSEVGLYGKLYVNFHKVTVKDTTCTIRLLAKLDLPARATDRPRVKNLNVCHYTSFSCDHFCL